MSSRIFATKDILYPKSLQLEIERDISEQGCTTFCILASRMQENGERVRRWRWNGERMRKWRENEEMERDSLSTFPHFLFISSLSIHFLYQKLYHFGAKWPIRHFCRECHKKIIIRAMKNNSGSTSLWESSASCEGLFCVKYFPT